MEWSMATISIHRSLEGQHARQHGTIHVPKWVLLLGTFLLSIPVSGFAVLIYSGVLGW